MTYLIIILIISFLILIHELGHFMAAHWAGIPIARFSIGFGPKLFGFKKGCTEYRLSLIPLGGYVMPDIQDENDLFQIPITKRIVFTIFGPLANITLAILCFAVINIFTQGFSLSGIFLQPFSQTLTTFWQILVSIPQIFSAPDQLSGILGIVVQGEHFINNSIINALNFSIFLSLNLAILNLLPIPALDGGKILLYLMEKIHPKLTRAHVPLTIIGFVLIIGLSVYTTVLDVSRHIVGSIL